MAVLPEEKKFEWAGEYMPWRLTFKAMTTIGKQAAVLLFVYVQICEFNPKSYLIIMHCRTETLGLWVYPCEVTKAFTRGFPLLAASVSMVAAGRFILQRRLFYHMYMRGAILDYANYRAYKDAVLIVLMLCFACSLSHFALDYCFPPYLTIAKATKVLSVYIIPCCVFFALFENIYNIERHLVPLPTVYEEDPKWAKQHLAKSDVFSAIVVRDSVAEAKKRLRTAQLASGGAAGVRYSVTDLLEETIKVARTGEIHNLEALAKEGNRFTGLFAGLWPGSILLDPCLNDAGSHRFFWAWRGFSSGFVVLQILIFGLLFSSSWKEWSDSRPQSKPSGALDIGHHYYTVLGTGYCRGDSMQRPYGYFAKYVESNQLPGHKAVEDLDLLGLPPFADKNFGGARRSKADASDEHRSWPPMLRRKNAAHPVIISKAGFAASKESTQMSRGYSAGDIQCGDTSCTAMQKACGQECSLHETCVGFATDPDMCSVYFSRDPKNTPDGWMAYTEISPVTWRRGEAGPRGIVQTNNYESATCFVRRDENGEPEDLVACIVYAFFALLIIWILGQAIRHALIDRLGSVGI